MIEIGVISSSSQCLAGAAAVVPIRIRTNAYSLRRLHWEDVGTKSKIQKKINTRTKKHHLCNSAKEIAAKNTKIIIHENFSIVIAKTAATNTNNNNNDNNSNQKCFLTIQFNEFFYGRNVKCSKQTAAAATTHHMKTNEKTRCMRKITSFEQCQRFYFSLFPHLVGCLYVNRTKSNTSKNIEKYRSKAAKNIYKSLV